MNIPAGNSPITPDANPKPEVPLTGNKVEDYKTAVSVSSGVRHSSAAEG